MANRKVNSFRNIVFGIIYQVTNLILSFICRTLLIQKLGSEILGINSLYSNILTLFSLAELGISNVMLIKLYKPIAEGNEQQIAAYIKYYKKIYSTIALIICAIGLIFVPFLHLIVSTDISITNADLIIYYLIFLLNIVFSYLLVYKQTLLNANQEFYILKIFNFFTIVIRSVVAILTLIIYPNYKLYLALECLCNVLSNIVIHLYAGKKYPYLKNNTDQIAKEQKKELFSNVKDTFLYKLGGVLVNNTDSIIISATLSTLLVGYLANYNLIITAISGFTSIIVSAIYASVGNLSVENNPEKSRKIFNTTLLVFHYIAAFCAITMFCCFNDFISLWLNNSEYILSWHTVLALCANFYLMTIILPIYIFRENYGLFKKVKYLFLVAAVINIVTSILLAKVLGLTGVILGTIICRLSTTVFFEPPYLYKEVFKSSSKDYFLRQSKMLFVSLIAAALCFFSCYYLPFGWLYFILKILICFVIVSLLFLLFFGRTQETKYVKDMALEMKNKFLSRNKKDEKTN